MNDGKGHYVVAGNPAAGLAKGVEVNDKDYLDRFPFLAPAHQGLLQGHGGINVLSRDGHFGIAHNTPRMAWAYKTVKKQDAGIIREN